MASLAAGAIELGEALAAGMGLPGMSAISKYVAPALFGAGAELGERALSGAYGYSQRYADRYGRRIARKLLQRSRSRHSRSRPMGRRVYAPYPSAGPGGGISRFRRPPSWARGRPLAKRRRVTRRRGRKVSFHPVLNRRLRKLECKANQTVSTKIHRYINPFQVDLTTYGTTAPLAMDWNLTNTKSSFLSMAYFEQDTPGTPDLVDVTGGAYSQSFCVDYMRSILRIRNNGTMPQRMRAFLCVPKMESANGALTDFQNGIAKDPGTLTSTDKIVYLNDSSQFRHDWNIVKTYKCFLTAGAHKSISYKFKQFKFDPSQAILDTTAFQKKYNNHTWVLLFDGDTIHDKTTTGNVNQTNNKWIDVIRYTTVKITYDGGASWKQIDTTDTTANIAAGAQVEYQYAPAQVNL